MKRSPNSHRKPRRGSHIHQNLTSAEARKEFESLVSECFALADSGNNGSIEFGEFLAHHEKFMDAATELPPFDYQDTENNFRRLDKDHSGGLDMQEFKEYMESLLAVLGARSFRQTCQEFIEKEQQHKEAEANGFDWRFSERLVEQARVANFYIKGLQDKSISFLDQKADPNHVDQTGSHCLLYAVTKASPDFIARLLEYRANPLLHNKAFDCAALRCARARNLESLAHLLMPGSAEIRSPEQAQASKELVVNMHEATEASIQKLLRQQADINFKDNSGWTPLTAAVFFGDLGRVEALLRTQKGLGVVKVKKLRLDIRNGRGRAPLHIAARKGFDNMIMPLVRAKGNPDGQDIDGWTPLHHAAFNGMDSVIDMLLEAGADLLIQGRGGMTPWQVTKLPICSGSISEETLDKLKPTDSVDFTKSILPVLKDDDLRLYEKLEQLLSLPTVCQQTRNLRLHEQCFDPRHGPNKIRLRKTWELLAMPMIKRMHSGDTDWLPPRSSMAEDAVLDRNIEIAHRQKEQQMFVVGWLKATKGLRPGKDWKHENRPQYGDSLKEVLQTELLTFETELDELYKTTLELEGGEELAELSPEEVLMPQFATQLTVHPIPVWVETLNPAGAFEALRLAGAFHRGKDDDDALLEFMDFINLEQDFNSGPLFWRNVYRWWLSEYAKAADAEFHKQIKVTVDRFKELYDHDPNMHISYQPGPVKSYASMKHKEKEFGKCTHEDYKGRTLASRILDLVRGSITVSCPSAVLALLNDFFRPMDGTHSTRLQLVRIRNQFHKDARTEHGVRNLVLTLRFNSGLTAGRCGRPGASMQVALLGEVQINLESFSKVHERQQVLYDCHRGMYDWEPENDEDLPPNSARCTACLQVDDDLPQLGGEASFAAKGGWSTKMRHTF